MAETPYDKLEDEELKSLTPEAIRKLEENQSGAKEPEEADEDGEPEESEEPEEPEHPGEKHVREEAEKEKVLSDKLRDQWQSAKDEDSGVFKTKHEGQLGHGYTKGGSPPAWRSWAGKNRKWVFGGSIAAAGIVGIFLVMFSFLNLFKLDGIMSNVDARTFARLNGVEDRRSVSWMQAYMQMRLADIGDNPNLNKGSNSDNAFFRASSVNNGNPIIDWYRTLRTSKFEQQ